MKRITTIFAAILMTASVFLPQQASAQAPQKMSYQAVVRNSSDALITSTSVGMRISILQGAANGTAVYVETQTPTTNTNGLVSLEIGAGIIVSGDFSTIDWANGPYFIRTETDPNGGANYTITGTSELLSVPYALFSANGTPGPQGAQGPQGPAGPAGVNGTNGTNGLDGNGITSTTDNGDGTFTFTYDDGSTFTTSDLTGPQGATGAQGAQGIQGIAGINGAVGATGPQGIQGIDGPQGPVGNNGTNGANGFDGNGITSTTDNGDGTFTLTYDDGSSFTTSNLTGPQGATGAQGPQGLQGIQGPQGPAGANGTNGANGLDGNGITSTIDNGDGTFTFTYDDGSTFTTSDLTGPQGTQGSSGNNGIAQIGNIYLNAATTWVMPGWSVNNTTSRSAGSNTIYYNPIYVDDTTVYSGIGFTLVTNTATICRLGIYNWQEGFPSTLVVDFGTIDCSTSAGLRSIISSYTLGPGYYFIAASFTGSTSTVSGASEWDAPVSGRRINTPGVTNCVSIRGSDTGGAFTTNGLPLNAVFNNPSYHCMYFVFLRE